MSVLARNGIPGPRPSLITGNVLEYMSMPSIDTHKTWIAKYGKVMGYYFGAKPVVLVADKELVKNIQIKDFNNFADRQVYAIHRGLHPNPIQDRDLVQSRGKQWKGLRNILTPTFSSHKLKTLTPIMESVVNDMLDVIEEHSTRDQEFDIYETFQSFTADVITRTAFGINTGVQRNPNDKYLVAAKDVFRPNINRFAIFLIICFPQLDLIYYPFRRLREIYDEWRGLSPIGIHLALSRRILALREAYSGPPLKDLLQIMLDSMKPKVFNSNANKKSFINQTNGPKVQNNGNNSGVSLTKDDIIANCVLFYEAGYETTSTALAFVAHILVNRPDIQETVRQEVRRLYETDGKLDFNVVNGLEYLECVIQESMRLYPPVITFISRECLTDYAYKDMIIPKDTSIVFAAHHLHHDPDYWCDPEVFDPKRFGADQRADIHAGVWQAFGAGPRNCVGMRLALLQMKLCLAKLVLTYRLAPGPHDRGVQSRHTFPQTWDSR